MKNDISEIKLFLFDMDGTLYLGNRLFEFTPRLLRAIKAAGGRYMFMTNNSSKSVDDYIKKLAALGINSVPDDYITSAQATVYYLKQNHSGAVLYVCGTQSLKNEFSASGFTVTDNVAVANCVVMGFDTELTFKKLNDVCKILSERNVPYIATHPDSVCPTEYGSVPDCGSVCDMVYNATGKRPVTVGKPSPLMPRLAIERTGTNAMQAAVIGDRLNTDIMSGINSGILSILVLTGETTAVTASASDIKPDVILQNAGQLIELL